MYNGMIRDSHDPSLGEELKRSHRLCEAYNRSGVDDEAEKQAVLKELFGTDDFGDDRSLLYPGHRRPLLDCRGVKNKIR